MKFALFGLSMFMASVCAASDCALLNVEEAWSRLAPPGAPVMAGYAQLTSRAKQTLTISATNSSDFERVELHSMSMHDGVMRMRKLDSLAIEPGATLRLAPGGMHLMLIGPKREFAAGDRIPVDIDLCGEGKPQRIQLQVRAD